MDNLFRAIIARNFGRCRSRIRGRKGKRFGTSIGRNKEQSRKKKDETGKDTEVETRARTSIDAEERAGAEVEGLSNCKLTWYITHLGLQVQMAHPS